VTALSPDIKRYRSYADTLALDIALHGGAAAGTPGLPSH
jgi:hypothetical protein